MQESKKHQLHDLIEKIDRVDQLIKFHSSNPSSFMSEQYESKKEKLLSYLIDELVDSKIRSPHSFRLIFMALLKYYPEISDENSNLRKTNSSLNDLEAVLIA